MNNRYQQALATQKQTPWHAGGLMNNNASQSKAAAPFDRIDTQCGGWDVPISTVLP